MRYSVLLLRIARILLRYYSRGPVGRLLHWHGLQRDSFGLGEPPDLSPLGIVWHRSNGKKERDVERWSRKRGSLVNDGNAEGEHVVGSIRTSCVAFPFNRL